MSPLPVEGRKTDVRLFPPFRLDVTDERLWNGTQEVSLRRKPFAILRHLTSHPLRLVTQEELVEAVWGKIAMSEGVLRTHIADLRRVLGPGLVETVAGRGFRFLREVEAESPDAPPKERKSTPPASKLIGRSREMAALQEAFERVRSGERQVVFVLGDSGVGKTALADEFVARVARPEGALIARGVCVEQVGPGEAYLPILEAIGTVCRDSGGAGVVEVLKRHAPTWIAQLPALLSDEALQSVLLRSQGGTQARMLRELAEALEALAGERPVVLVLEDLQWSDPSTTDLIALLGSRREAARLLVLATCRPAEVPRGEGLGKALAQLGAHKRAVSVSVKSWPDPSVEEYLRSRFPHSRFPASFPATIRRMTGGNPLFVGAVIDDLQSRGMIGIVAGQWELTADEANVGSFLPDTVRSLIDIQIDRLAPTEQRILEAASIIGLDFVVGRVAHALGIAPDDVDTTCETLAGERRFLRFVATEPWPDGTLQPHYAFVHDMYREAARARVPGATRRAWHRKIANGLEASHGGDLDEISAELALHFDAAQAHGQAVRYYCAAGERAMKRFGRAEALAHFDRARELLSRLPMTDESERTELRLLQQIAPTSIALRGFQGDGLEQTLDRTVHLANKLGEDRTALAAFLGLQRFHMLQGHLRAVESYEAPVASVLARLADPVASAQAAIVSYSARLHRGQLNVARGPLVDACKVLDAAGWDPARSVNAPVVGLWSTHIVILEWLSGAPDEAVSAATRMLARASSLEDPVHLAAALAVAALVHRLRREPEPALDLGRRALEVARDARLPLWEARAMSVYHWAAAVLEPKDAVGHFTALSSALAPLLKTGFYNWPAILVCVIDLFSLAGRETDGVREIDDALRYVEESDERAWESELHRLRGDLVREKDPAGARSSFERAFEIAHRQGARSFELRAALSIAKVSRGDDSRAALDALLRTYATFREGFQTADLVEAKVLLSPRRPARRS
jgi:DNA-binding winged helix-turn-helix (wHTH) protein